MTQRPKTAVVIPAYQAERSIQAVIETIPDFIEQIIVVNDCSADRTGEIAAEMAQTNPKITLIEHAVNTGVGGAVMDGYKKALQLGCGIVVKMDSDGQMDPAYLGKLIRPVAAGTADYAKGNRFLHVNELNAMPFVRRIGNISLSFITKISSGYWNVFDPTNGYTAINAAVLPLIRADKIHRRFFFESSLLHELGILRAVVTDVDIPARYNDEKSSLSELDSLLRFPLPLMMGILNRIVTQYFVRDFTAVSLFLVTSLPMIVFGLGFGIYHWVKSIQTQVPATTGTVMLATVPLIVGVQLLIQTIAMDIQNTPTRPISPELVEEPRLEAR